MRSVCLLSMRFESGDGLAKIIPDFLSKGQWLFWRAILKSFVLYQAWEITIGGS